MKTQEHVRTLHDEWGKRALSLWLGDLGDVQIDARIAGESRRGDVLYTERRGRPARRRKLGVLGEIARGTVLFEFFRNPLIVPELKSCVLKIVDIEAQQIRAARRAKRKRSSVVAPMLCAITPSMSPGFAVEAEATRLSADKPGLYRLAPMWGAVIVVVNELPGDHSTLWLRLLGRGAVQAEAVRELAEMSRREPLRDATLELLIAWRQSLPPPEQQTEDEQELAMNLERIYQNWEQKTLAKGEARGRAEGEAKGKVKGRREGKADAVLAVLDSRGLTVTAAQRKQVLACTDEAQLDAWLRAAATAPSVSALLAGGAARRLRAK